MSAENILPASAIGGSFDAASTAVQRSSWGAIAALTLLFFGGSLLRTVFGPLQEAVTLDLHLSDFQMSLVQGLAVGIPGALICLPIAWIIDHGRRVRLLFVLMMICTVGTLWTSFVEGFLGLFVCRMLSAVSAGCIVAVVISLTADYCVSARRGRAMVVLMLGLFAGVAVGYALSGGLLGYYTSHPLGSMVPWRAAHLMAGLFGGVSLLAFPFLREPARHEVAHIAAALRPTLQALWKKRAFLIPFFVGGLGVTLADTGATIWAAPVLIRNYHLHPQDFAGWMGGLLFVGGIFGTILGGLGADWGQKSNKRGALLNTAVLAALIGIPGAFFPLMPSVSGFAWLMGLLTLSGTAIGLVMSTTVAVLLPNEERGVCMALYGIVNAVIGQGIAPTLVTVVSRLMGGDEHLATALATTGLVTGALSVIGYVFAVKNAPLSPTQMAS